MYKPIPPDRIRGGFTSPSIVPPTKEDFATNFIDGFHQDVAKAIIIINKITRVWPLSSLMWASTLFVKTPQSMCARWIQLLQFPKNSWFEEICIAIGKWSLSKGSSKTSQTISKENGLKIKVKSGQLPCKTLVGLPSFKIVATRKKSRALTMCPRYCH